MHFIHLNFSSLLPIIMEIRHFAKLINASVVGISEINLMGLFWIKKLLLRVIILQEYIILEWKIELVALRRNL